MVVSAGWYACAGDADQKGNVFRADGGERHDPSGLADAEQANLRAVDIAACLQVLEGGHDVAGQIVERSRVPVPGRSTDTPFVVPEDRHAAAYQEPRPGSMYSRFSAPEPCTRMIAGCFPPVAG